MKMLDQVSGQRVTDRFNRPVVALLGALLVACSGGSGSDLPVRPAPGPIGVDPLRMPWVAGLRCSGAAQTGWCWQRPQPDGLATQDVQFVNASHGWVVGDNGSIRQTRDGGLTWADQVIGTRARFTQVRLADIQHGWAFTEQGQVWRTQDGGTVWQRLGEVGFAVRAVQGLPPGVFVASGVDRTAISRDAGATWIEVPTLGEGFVTVDVDGALWIVDISPQGAGRTRISRDMGVTWQDSPASTATTVLPAGVPRINAAGFAWMAAADPAQPGQYVYLLRRQGVDAPWVRTSIARVNGPNSDVPNLLAVDTAGGVLARSANPDDPNVLWRSADGGQTWSRIDLPAVAWPSPSLNVDAIDSRTLVIRLAEDVTRRTHFLSTDAGRTWRAIFTDANEQNHYAVGLRRDALGALVAHVEARANRWWRSTDDGLTWAELPGSNFAGDSPWVGLLVGADGKGLAVSRWGTFLDTQDGGRHWTTRTDLVAAYVSDFAEQADGGLSMIAAGTAGDGLLRSADRGRSWTRAGASLPPEGPRGVVPSLQRILYANGPVLHVLAEVRDTCLKNCPLYLYHSSNGGQTWQRGPLLGVAPFEVRMTYATPSVALGYKGSVLQRSTDAGDTWADVSAPGVSGYGQKIAFVDAQNAWVVGPNSLLLRSRDGGLVWDAVPVPAASAADASLRHTFNDIAFADPLHGWIVGAGGLVLATRDGGQTWEQQLAPTSEDLVMVKALDAKTAWVVGANGAILVTASGGWTAR